MFTSRTCQRIFISIGPKQRVAKFVEITQRYMQSSGHLSTNYDIKRESQFKLELGNVGF